MQIGEPAETLGASGMPTAWAGEVVEVTFHADIASARDKAEITGPNWRIGVDMTDDWPLATKLGLPSGTYSKKPAVYLVRDAGGFWDVEVKVQVTRSENIAGTGKLIGSLGFVTIEGECPLEVGTHTVYAKIVEPPETIHHVRGLLRWGIEAEGLGSWALNRTLVELFFILAPPIGAYEPGVWVEALRLVCQRATSMGLKPGDEARVVAGVTQYCHSGHGVKYDTVYGASSFEIHHDGGVFSLSRYLAKSPAVVNCYDQAGAVQTLAGAVGVRMEWLFLEPFGYILPTNLVGVGLCNNPFYRQNGSKKNVPTNDPRRTSFRNHAFIEHAKVHDACAGPHVGTESRHEYVKASIDVVASHKRDEIPGDAEYIEVYPGVASLS